MISQFKSWLICGASAVIFLGGCASSSLQIQTTPEGADVLVIRANGTPLKFGVTPLTVTAQQFPDVFMDNFQIEVNKEGYLTESALIPKSSLQSRTNLNFILRDIRKSETSFSDHEKNLNDISQGVAESQRLVIKKNFSEARRILKEMLDRYPNVATLHTLIGNTYYLEKDIHGALESYKRARELQINNPETARMIEKLQGMTPVSPVSGSGN